MSTTTTPRPTITSIHPLRAVDGGRLVIRGSEFPVDNTMSATVGDQPARVIFASSTRLVLTMPAGVEGGRVPVRVDAIPGETAYVSAGVAWATGLHQVDNPVFDRDGNLFVTYSGSRGEQTPVSVFRVTRAGTREPFASGIVNATSMAYSPDGHLYVSSRFEGSVYRVDDKGEGQQVATDLGVACGIAFDDEGWMYVGDRSGTIFRVRDGRTEAFASVPPSIAAFHLALSPDQELFVSAPTLGSYDHVYHIDRQGDVRVLPASFGRPQGVAFSPDGVLHVVEALAGTSGLYRLPDLNGSPELVVSGNALVGVAFGPAGEIVVTSNDTVYRFD